MITIACTDQAYFSRYEVFQPLQQNQLNYDDD